MEKSVTIRPVRTRRDRKRFMDLPYRLYKDNPFWTPPLRLDTAHTLNPKKNPFFEHGRLQTFLAEDASGAVVGRIAGIVNGMHLKKYDDGNGFFGFFECEERYEIAEALFDAAAAWLRDQGMTGMRGPTNPTLNDIAGLLVDGFDRTPAILMAYNPPYYQDFLLRYGFERVMTLWAYYVHNKYVKKDRLRRGAAIVHRRNPGLTVRNINMKRFDEEARIVLDIFNEAWSNNWGFVPITDGEFARLAADLKQIVDPRMVYIVEKDGEPVAFSLSLPNINFALKHLPNGRLLPLGLLKLLASTKLGGVHDVRMPLMGVRQAYQGRAFDVLPVLATIENGPSYGYYACETSWVLDTNNVLKNLLLSIGCVVDKEYGMFERSL